MCSDALASAPIVGSGSSRREVGGRGFPSYVMHGALIDKLGDADDGRQTNGLGQTCIIALHTYVL